MKKVIIIALVHENLIQQLQQKGFETSYFPKIAYEELSNLVEDAEGIIVTARLHIDQQLIEKAKKLKWIGRLGSGMELIDVAFAEKKGIISDEDKLISHKNMLTLNNAGEILGSLNYVSSMTDVTGFGLAGHLLEVCESSNTSAKLKQENIPLLCSLEKYINENAIPGGTNRNWSSYGNKITSISKELQIIISDPQTSGGLLFTIPKNYEEEFLKYCERSEVKEKLPFICKIGEMVKSEDKKLIFE